MGEVRERWVETRGLRFFVREAGPEDGPLLVLLHGFPELAEMWEPLMAPLAAQGFRVVAPDQRGYGRSERPTGVAAYGLERLVDDVGDLIEALGPKPAAAVVGHDWGGAVVWGIGRLRPELAERLVVINCPEAGVLKRVARRSLAQLRRSWYIALFQLPFLAERVVTSAWLAKALKGTARRGAFDEHLLLRYQEAWQ